MSFLMLYPLVIITSHMGQLTKLLAHRTLWTPVCKALTCHESILQCIPLISLTNAGGAGKSIGDIIEGGIGTWLGRPADDAFDDPEFALPAF